MAIADGRMQSDVRKKSLESAKPLEEFCGHSQKHIPSIMLLHVRFALNWRTIPALISGLGLFAALPADPDLFNVFELSNCSVKYTQGRVYSQRLNNDLAFWNWRHVDKIH